MPTLFDPIKIGDLELTNRIIMAPLTRCRAEPGRVPGDLMVEYYAQRADAGLIISDTTSVTPMGVGYPGHARHLVGRAGARLEEDHRSRACQGRQDRAAALACGAYLRSAVPRRPVAGRSERHQAGWPCQPGASDEGLRNSARAGNRREIPAIVEAYRKGAENAKEAGFDGVEIHGANGYLLDQFLQDSTNQRTDAYGGSLENRARLMLEVTDAAISVWGAGRVGVHLAPRADSHDMGDSNRAETFGYVARELGKRGVAFICTREYAGGKDSLGPQLKQIFGGVYIANERFTKEQGNAWLAEGKADAVAFGIPYIANPDLVERLRQDAPLNAPTRSCSTARARSATPIIRRSKLRRWKGPAGNSDRAFFVPVFGAHPSGPS
ncbi:Alkene reductase OS=Stutzerimonas stutzeri OX=316 GN=CXK95_17335 PE=4 SV=1 [Stutzerimonas stutzeri]